jgi:ubiquinol-cytochrome c reductase core subunit 2
MKEDLPYFAELLAEVATLNKYQRECLRHVMNVLTDLAHVLHEIIEPLLEESHGAFLASSEAVALQGAHTLAFHRGLGAPLTSLTSKPFHLHAEEVEAYGSVAYSKPNFALVGSGVAQSDLSKWTGEFFKDVSTAAPSGLPALSGAPAKFFGGEERISSTTGNTIIIGFSGSSTSSGASYKPEIDALASLLGGQSIVKWGSGTSLLAKAAETHGVKIKTESAKYSDAGLLYVTISGSAKGVAAAAKDAAAAIKSLTSAPKDAVKAAIAQAKFKAYDVETGEAPTLDVIGLSAVAGNLKGPEETLKGISSVSEAAVTSVRLHSVYLDYH